MVDFAALKTRVSIEQVLDMLGIETKKSGEQLRSKCPVCDNKSDRSLVVTPSKQLWYAFCCSKGGDCIALVAFVRKIDTKQAAAEIEAQFSGPSETRTEAFGPLPYLEPGHPSVASLGFPEGVAKRGGVGFAGKGIMRGRVCVPIRDETGRLLGYIGYSPALEPQLKLPPKWH